MLRLGLFEGSGDKVLMLLLGSHPPSEKAEAPARQSLRLQLGMYRNAHITVSCVRPFQVPFSKLGNSDLKMIAQVIWPVKVGEIPSDSENLS